MYIYSSWRKFIISCSYLNNASWFE